jgi:hypothetical protein
MIGALKGEIRRHLAQAHAPVSRYAPKRLERKNHERRPRDVLHDPRKSSGDCSMTANKAGEITAYSTRSRPNIFTSFRIIDSSC